MRALEMITTGVPISAGKALSYGFLDVLVDTDLPGAAVSFFLDLPSLLPSFPFLSYLSFPPLPFLSSFFLSSPFPFALCVAISSRSGR